MSRLALSACLGLSACVIESAGPKGILPPPAPPPVAAVAQLRADAKRLGPLYEGSALVQRFLAATNALPFITPRVLSRDGPKTRFWNEREAAALPETERSALVRVDADEELYYNTKYGSPLSYARPLQILGELPPGAKIFDFGYGYVGHLRLLGSLGFDLTGVDVDPLLRALYTQPEDQGQIAPFDGSAAGRVRLIDGRFPADPAIVGAVSGGYQLIISKNVLKKGYIHPDRPADERRLIKLGATDEVVLATFHAALAPGGRMLIYNICPALTPPDKPFVPWSDGRSPFTRQQWEAAGFEVLAIDQDDAAAVRIMGHTLGWDVGEDRMDLENDLSVLYTLVRRP